MKARPADQFDGVSGLKAASRPRIARFVLFLFLAAASFFPTPGAGAAGAPDHSEWRRLLDTYLTKGEGGRPNLVDYGRLKAISSDSAALKGYIASLERTDPETLSRDDRFAFWVNLYNALTVDVVVDYYPVASIRDIPISPGLFSKGPWGRKLVTVAGRELSLDDIEHGILRADFKDARIHYAVNCASWSCPDLAPVPYEGEKLEAMLNEAARLYINSSRGADIRNGDLKVSSIFDWYMEDFGGNEAGVLTELRKYAEPDLAAALENISGISSYRYDWSLNDSAGAADAVKDDKQ